LAPRLVVKGFGLISTICPITSEGFGPLTQQIGPAPMCKAAFRMKMKNTSFKHNIVTSPKLNASMLISYKT